MKSTTLLRNKRRTRRTLGLRSRIRRQSTLPRLSVNRSLKHIAAQVIDDVGGRTLASVSSTSKKLAGELDGKTKSEKSAVIGKEIARLAQEAGVAQVVFDRGHAKYHGRVKALADAAREGGLKF
ncbi:MAG: large subunit ribosomal protein L18 [Planctomycetota bacterium]|jgi:large subunit ribosomal protein L18